MLIALVETNVGFHLLVAIVAVVAALFVVRRKAWRLSSVDWQSEAGVMVGSLFIAAAAQVALAMSSAF